MLPCNTPAKAIHLLSGVSGWGYPGGQKGTVSMIVRLHYADGKTEDHAARERRPLRRLHPRVDVPGSKLAFTFRGQQIRYLAVHPGRSETIKRDRAGQGPGRRPRRSSWR